MSADSGSAQAVEGEIARLRRETETLYAVINTVASSLELDRVLEGIVEIATEATDCHACFVYFRERDRLVLRAASPVYREVVGKVSIGIDEGLTGWVARTRRPELIREGAMADPRMKYVPELEEERFQSMVAVPVSDRAGEVIGVIVLHTEAPREFDRGVVNLLVHIASLVAGAIENARLFDATQRRAEAEGTVGELLDALADGALDVARARAADLDLDLGRPHAYLSAQPAREAAGDWTSPAERLTRELEAHAPGVLVHSTHDLTRALIPGRDSSGEPAVGEVGAACEAIASRHGLAIGLGRVAREATEAPGALRQAEDARRVAHALLPSGGARGWEELGAYRYLVGCELPAPPGDRHSAAVATLREYDRRRGGELTETLERLLAERGSRRRAAEALFIHPNTLRQRLARIEELTSLDLAQEDLLSLELALKLHRLRA